jgi:hypothetical protein
MADAHDDRPERRPRAANASYLDKVRQAVDAQPLERVLARLASGLPRSSVQPWLDTLDPLVSDAVGACEQKDSRFLPAGYLLEPSGAEHRADH